MGQMATPGKPIIDFGSAGMWRPITMLPVANQSLSLQFGVTGGWFPIHGLA